jgi:hypothetical protein
MIKRRSLFIFVALMGGFANANSPARPSELSAEIVKNMHELLIPDNREEAAARTLKGFPRDKVIDVVRENLLKTGPDATAALMTASRLELTEVLSDLRAQLGKSQEWQLPLTISVLSKNPAEKDKTVQAYLERLKTPASSPFTNVMVDGLTSFAAKIPPATFKKLATNSNFDVQSTSVQHFTTLRSSYSVKEQVDNFRLGFSMRSPRARTAIYKAYAALSPTERKALGYPLASRNCASDRNTEAKTFCEKALASIKVGAQ